MHDLPLIAAAPKREQFGFFASQGFELADTSIRTAIRDGRQAFAHFLQDESAGLILGHDNMGLAEDSPHEKALFHNIQFTLASL